MAKVGKPLERNAVMLSAPQGPIALKYDTFRLLGEPPRPTRHQEIWAMGAVSTAKTNALCDAIIISADNYPGARLLLLRDTMENARLSVWDTLKRRAAELIDSGKWKVVEHLNMIRCINGSEIHIFGADTADNKLWGQEWFRAFVDQGEQLKEGFIKLLHTRIRQQVRHALTGQLGATHIKLTANWTEGRNWIYNRVVKKGTEVTPDFWEQKYTAKVKFKGEQLEVKAYVCMILSRTEENESNTESYMRHIVLAGEIGELATSPTWAEEKGQVFGDLREDFILDLNDPLLSAHYSWDAAQQWRNKTCVMSMDWGIWHPYHILYSQVDQQGRCVVVAESQDSGISIEDTARRMAVQLNTYYRQGCREFYLYYDIDMHRKETDLQRIIDKFLRALNALLPFGVVANPAVTHKKGTIETGASEVMTRVGAQQFFVVENNCPHTTQVFEQLTWADVEKDTFGLVDAFDALRYLALNLTPFTPQGGFDDDQREEDEPRWAEGANLKMLDERGILGDDDDEKWGSDRAKSTLRTWKWGRHQA